MARSDRVVLAVTARRAARPGVLWGLLFGVMIAATEHTYLSSFPTRGVAPRLAQSLEGNTGFAALFGRSTGWTPSPATRSTR